jgi:hypothetical protein
MRRISLALCFSVWAAAGAAQAQGLVRPATLLLAAQPTTGSAVATWSANPPAELVTGYRLSYGTVPGSHPTTIDAGNVLTLKVMGLQSGTTYYFVLVAYGAAGRVSPPTPEVPFTMPAASGCTDGQGPISIGISGWTSPIAIGSQGIVSLSALTGPQAMIRLQARLTLNGVVSVASDVPDATGDLRSVRALAISVPVVAGVYNLTVQATDTRGCVFETPGVRPLTVQ